MNTKSMVGIGVLVLIVAIVIVAISMHHGTSTALINTPSNTQTSGTPLSGQTTANSSKTLFSSTQYAPYSYVIYPGPISQQAQSALAGFNLTSTTLQNSSTEIKLTLVGTGQSQSILLNPNYKLYIVETTFGDDGYHFDSSLGDDGFVIVDPNGYVA